MAKSFAGLGPTAGLAADRTSMTGMSAGQQFYETDTNKVYVYTGVGWVEVSALNLTGGLNTGVYNALRNYVTVQDATTRSTTAGSPQATGLSLSITPTFASSKIEVSFDCAIQKSTGAENRITLYLYRGGTELTGARYTNLLYQSFSATLISSASRTYIDSPATTSPVTYAVYYESTGSAGTVYLNNYGSVNASWIRAREILT